MGAFDLLPPLDEPVSRAGALLPTPIRPRAVTLSNLREDAKLVRDGVLDWRSFLSGYRRQFNPVEVVVRDRNGKIKQIRRQHNLRVTMGRDNWQRLAMFGDIAANANYTGNFGAATAISANTLTNSGAAFPTAGGVNGGLQGHMLVAMSSGAAVAWGVITSNTATVITVDKWHTPGSATDATATTPTSTTPYVILPHAGPACWVGLSTNATAPAAGDVPRTADGLFGDGTTGGAATEQTTNGLARTFVQPTFPLAGNIQFQNIWTYTGASTVSINKVVLVNGSAAAGNLMVLETVLNAVATVSLNGDTTQVTWTVTL